MESISKMGRIISGNTCIVGMGNYLKNDDAAGLYIVDEVMKNVDSKKYSIFNVEDIIESYVFKIAELDCENIIIIDALMADSSPGEIVFGKLNEFDSLVNNFSTHKLSLTVSGKVMEEHGKEVFLLGVVAENIDLGMELSSEIRKTADILSDFIIERLSCRQKEYVYEY